MLTTIKQLFAKNQREGVHVAPGDFTNEVEAVPKLEVFLEFDSDHSCISIKEKDIESFSINGKELFISLRNGPGSYFWLDKVRNEKSFSIIVNRLREDDVLETTALPEYWKFRDMFWSCEVIDAGDICIRTNLSLCFVSTIRKVKKVKN